jgi:hypothetical protein
VTEKYCVPLFDCYEYLDHLRPAGVDLNGLFRDEMHLQRPFCAEIAQMLLDRLLSIWEAAGPGALVSGLDYEYRYITVQDILGSPDNLTRKSTSLIAVNLAAYSGSAALAMPGFAGQELTAIGVDWANSRGKLTLGSRTSCTINLTTPYSGDDPARLVFGLYPLRDPVMMDGECLTLTLSEGDAGRSRLGLDGFVIRQPVKYGVWTRLPRSVVVSAPALRSDPRNAVAELFGSERRSSTSRVPG